MKRCGLNNISAEIAEKAIIIPADNTEGKPRPYAAFGAEIRRARDRAGLSRAQLAARLGLRRQSVQKWENGYAKPSARAYVDLVKFIGLQALPPRSVSNSTHEGSVKDV